MPTLSKTAVHQPPTPTRRQSTRRRTRAQRTGNPAESHRSAATPVIPLNLQGLQAICTTSQTAHRKEDIRSKRAESVVQALLDDARLAAVDPMHGSLDSRLITALEAAYPATEHTINLAWGEDNQLYLVINHHVDGYINLHALDRWLSQSDPHLLPGLFALLEERSFNAYPVCGPRGAQELATIWYDLDSVEENLLSEGKLKKPGRTSVRKLIRLAEKHGYNHPLCVRMAYGGRYFRIKYAAKDLLGAWRGCLASRSHSKALQTAWQRLSRHLEALLELPPVTLAENRAGFMDGTLYAVLFTTQKDEFCPAFEVIDEYFQMQMQVGEEQPCNALSLQVNGARSTLNQLEALLATHAAVRQIISALEDLNAACE